MLYFARLDSVPETRGLCPRLTDLYLVCGFCLAHGLCSCLNCSRFPRTEGTGTHKNPTYRMKPMH
jgi:hypothetical protein